MKPKKKTWRTNQTESRSAQVHCVNNCLLPSIHWCSFHSTIFTMPGHWLNPMRVEQQLIKEQKSIEAAEMETLDTIVSQRMKAWSNGKTIQQLLATMEEFYSGGNLPKFEGINVMLMTPSEVRSAYRKSVLAVHPDKMRDAPLNRRLEAQQLFACLTEAYQVYKQVMSMGASWWVVGSLQYWKRYR